MKHICDKTMVLILKIDFRYFKQKKKFCILCLFKLYLLELFLSLLTNVVVNNILLLPID